MSLCNCVCPDDLWGLSIEEAKRAIRGTGAWLTDKTLSFDVLKGFEIRDVGRLRIAAPSRKKLRSAIDSIHQAVRREKNPEPKDFSIYDKPKKPFKIHES